MSVTTQTLTFPEWRLWGQGYAWSTRYTGSVVMKVTRTTGSDTATVEITATMTTPSGDTSLGDWECVATINGASSGGGEKTFSIASAGYHAQNSSFTVTQTYTVNVGVSAGTLTGTVKLHVGGYSGYQGEYSDAQSWSLTYETKGTPSQATWSNYYFGNSSTITIQRTVPDFRESVYLVWQDDTSNPVTIRTYSQSSATTISYTIPYNTLPYNATTRSAKIRVVTYNGSTQIGTWETSAVSVTIKTGDTHYNPTLSANPTCEAYNDVVSALGTDTAVAQYSKLNVKAKKSNVVVSTDCPSGQTVTIASRVVTFSNGSSASADQENHISSVITSAGTVTWTYTVTDSRGLKVTRTGSYTVINSSAPTISNVTVYRGDSSGTAEEGGAYIYATATASCESLNGHNSVTLQGKVDSGSWQSMTSGTRKTLMTNADANTQYVVTLQATDLLRPTTQTIILPSLDCPFDMPETKHGVGIGMQGTSDDTLKVGYDAIFYGDIVKHDTVKNEDVDILKAAELLVPFGTEIVANKNLNTPEFLNVGRYYCPSYSTAITLSNCPTGGTAFVMTVRNITSDYTDTSNRTWMYLVREVITLNGDRYYQYCQSGSSISWTYGVWYRINSSLNSEGANVAQWLKAMVGRQSSIDFGHIYDGDKVHCRLDIVSGSLGSDSPFDGDGYVLTFMWDNSGAWDTQVFFPNGGGHPSFRKRGNGAWAKNAIQFVTNELSKDTYTNTSVKNESAICRRQGNVVSISASGGVNSLSANSYVNWVTIAEKYRPTEAQFVNVSNGVVSGRFAVINTNGVIQLFSSTAITSATNFAFNITYIVD